MQYQNLLSNLKWHILSHVRHNLNWLGEVDSINLDTIILKHGQMYQHKLMHVNYTSYNVWCTQDVINFSNSHHNIMILAGPNPNTRPTNEVEFFKYAWVLGTFHANIIYIGPGSVGHWSQRIEFLWVWCYEVIGAATAGWMHSKLDQLHFPPIAWRIAFGSVNPSDVIRVLHFPNILPRPATQQWRRYIIQQKGLWGLGGVLHKLVSPN